MIVTSNHKHRQADHERDDSNQSTYFAHANHLLVAFATVLY